VRYQLLVRQSIPLTKQRRNILLRPHPLILRTLKQIILHDDLLHRRFRGKENDIRGCDNVRLY
jgi:hypothetical protein